MCRKTMLTISVIIAFIGLIYFVRAYRAPGGVVQNINVSQNYDFTAPTPTPLNPDPKPLPLKQTAWFPDWDYQKALVSFRQVADKLDSISPVWYYYEATGVKEARKGLEETMQIARANNVKVIPSIASFERDHVHEIFKDEQSVQKHVDYLLSEIDKYDYDGIDIDYESIHFPDQKGYFSLLEKLYTQLDRQGKILSVAVIPKWTDQLVTASLAETRKVQDWSEMSQFVHEMRIMAYELTTPNNTYPGPIAPLPWVESILEYATSAIPREKIYLGVHLYGYDGWAGKQYSQPYIGTNNSFEAKLQANPTTFEQMQPKFGKVKTQYLDPIAKEQILVYEDQGVEKTIVYQDAESLKYRVDLAKQYGVAGIAHWRMGREDLAVYGLTK